MQANPVPIGISDKRHPADSGLDWLDQDFNFAPPTLRNGRMDIGNSKRNRRRSLPMLFWFVAWRIEAKCHGRCFEFGPEAAPFATSFQSEHFLVKRSGSTHVSRGVHHKVDGSHRDGRCSFSAFGFLFHKFFWQSKPNIMR